MNGVNTMFSVE